MEPCTISLPYSSDWKVLYLVNGDMISKLLMALLCFCDLE